MSRIQTTSEPWQISTEIEVTIPFHDVDWAAVILDEAQNIKNAETKQARAAPSSAR